MSINSNEYFSLKKRYEEAKNNLLRYYSSDMVLYYIEELEEVADEILKSLAAEQLSNEVYNEEYPPED